MLSLDLTAFEVILVDCERLGLHKLLSTSVSSNRPFYPTNPVAVG